MNRSLAVTIFCLSVVACTHPAAAVVEPEKSLAAPIPTSAPDAAATDTTSFRDIVVPAQLEQEPAFAASKQCSEEATPAREHDRLVAAFDAELRKKGGWVLQYDQDEAPQQASWTNPPLGTISRGQHGERRMLVAVLTCQPQPQLAIDEQHTVFPYTLRAKAASRHSLHSCLPDCRPKGCGFEMPPVAVYAEVPDGATFDTKARTIDVPIDVAVDVIPTKGSCPARP